MHLASTRVLLLACALCAAAPAVAQSGAYPTRPLRIIASQAPGGGIDAVCRVVATRLSEAVGQSVIVDNRAGANGSVAGELTAKAPPDGYTLMLGAMGNLGINVFFVRKLGYDPLRDLAPVTLAVSGSNVLVVHPAVAAKSVKELIALARSRPRELAYSTSGTGGSGHLAGALFQRMTKTELLHVPYKGGGPAMIALIAGQTQLAFASVPSAATFINSGKLRALATSMSQRSRLLPDLPTLSEAGVPGYESQSWYGFVVPAKTPAPIVARLNKEIVGILHAPDVSESLLKLGLETWTSTPEAFGKHLRSEYEKWGRVIREAGITEQ